MKRETEFNATLQAHSWPKTAKIARTTMRNGRSCSTALALFVGFRVANSDLQRRLGMTTASGRQD